MAKLTQNHIDRAFANALGELKTYGEDLPIRLRIVRIKGEIEKFRMMK